MLGVLRETASDSNRLGESCIGSEIVFSRASDLAVGNEIGSLKIFQYYFDNRVIKKLRVGCANGLRELRYRQILYFDVAHSSQSHKTVGLNSHSLLIELRAQVEGNVKSIPSLNVIATVALLKLGSLASARILRG